MTAVPALLAACLALAVPATAGAQQWFGLDAPANGAGGVQVEVDLSTLRLRDGMGEAVVRVSHDTARRHPGGFSFRSLVATAQVDCTQRTVSLVSAAYFTQVRGQGGRAGVDSSGRSEGLPPQAAEAIPAHARQALLRAACPAP